MVMPVTISASTPLLRRYKWVGMSHSTNRRPGTQSTQLHPIRSKLTSNIFQGGWWSKPHNRGKSNLNHVEWTTRASKRPQHIVAKSEIGQRKGQNAWVRRLKWKQISSLTGQWTWWIGLPIMRTPRAQKAWTKMVKKPRRFTREKNVVSQFCDNDYMAYHYAFTMKIVTV